MNWWFTALLIVLLLAFALPYVFVTFKFAGAGWAAGIHAYLKWKERRYHDQDRSPR